MVLVVVVGYICCGIRGPGGVRDFLGVETYCLMRFLPGIFLIYKFLARFYLIFQIENVVYLL